ncbi:MAG TPA: ribosome small subunit-dependent GTPase A [Bacilli bacterium]|nr:ribosome small subunit-dependent GTPase A [Bacilli bacterium]
MEGRITRIISNLYTVESNGIEYNCRARGSFRNISLSPLVGDIVDFSESELYILNIHKRKNTLTRPNVANIDLCIIVTSLKRPDFSPFLLDKMIVNVVKEDIEPIICFTKYDLLNEEERNYYNKIISYYESIGYKVFINNEIDKFNRYTAGSLVVLTGQTGVGKSTFINKLIPEINLETNDISDALGRGKHTTRHTEIYKYNDTYIVDTPGFSSLEISDDYLDNLRFYFPEFENDSCKFRDCKHLQEIGCKVQEDVLKGKILPSRYESYKKMVMKDEGFSLNTKKQQK